MTDENKSIFGIKYSEDDNKETESFEEGLRAFGRGFFLPVKKAGWIVGTALDGGISAITDILAKK